MDIVPKPCLNMLGGILCPSRISVKGKQQAKFLCRRDYIIRIGKLGLDLFPNLPIIGRNTLSPNEFNLQPLPYCRPYCGPYY
jgi:hypothetical protein